MAWNSLKNEQINNIIFKYPSRLKEVLDYEGRGTRN
jgi:hypothetical protein